MSLVEEGNDSVERVAVCTLRVGLRRSRSDEQGQRVSANDQAGHLRCDDVIGDIAEIEVCFRVPGAWACDDLSQEVCHGCSAAQQELCLVSNENVLRVYDSLSMAVCDQKGLFSFGGDSDLTQLHTAAC